MAVEQAKEMWLRTKDIDSLEHWEVMNYVSQLGEGWIAEEALAISLFCGLLFEHDFESGVCAAVNHSGDSDSTGAITGNILGLINGLEEIPEEWIFNLQSSEIVRLIAIDLCNESPKSINLHDKEWWMKYPGI